MAVKISALRHNLLELYACKNREEIIPSRSGRSIYTSRSIRGKIVKFFLPKNRIEELRNEALANLRLSIHLMMEELGDRQREYLENSLLKSEGKQYAARELQLAEDRILGYFSKLSGFWKDLEKGRENFAVKTVSEWYSADLFRKSAHFIRFVERNKNIEIVMGGELPLRILSKMSRGISLKARDESLLKEWIEALKIKRWKSIPSYRGPVANLFHKTRAIQKLFQSLFDVYFAKDSSADMVHLTSGLYHLGLKTLVKNDPVHDAWRNGLKKGDRIAMPSGEVILGDELSNERERLAGYRRFLIENDEQGEAHFYPTASRLYLEVDCERQSHYGIPLAPIKEIEPKGKMLVRLRISTGLNLINWDSNGYSLNDRKYFYPLKDLMKVFAELSYTPSDFYPEGFGFATDGRIYARYIMIDQPFSFEALENFAWECSRGKFLIYRKLMKRLKNKERLNEYRELFMRVIFDSNHSGLIDLDGTISHQEILHFRKELYAMARDAYEELHQRLAKLSLKQKGWEKLLKEAMKECYVQLGCVRLPPDFAKCVIDLLKKKHPKIFPKGIAV